MRDKNDRGVNENATGIIEKAEGARGHISNAECQYRAATVICKKTCQGCVELCCAVLLFYYFGLSFRAYFVFLYFCSLHTSRFFLGQSNGPITTSGAGSDAKKAMKLLKKPQLRQGYCEISVARRPSYEVLYFVIFIFSSCQNFDFERTSAETNRPWHEAPVPRNQDGRRETDTRQRGRGQKERKKRRDEGKRKKGKEDKSGTSQPTYNTVKATRYKRALWERAIAFAMLLRPLWILFFRGSFTLDVHR